MAMLLLLRPAAATATPAAVLAPEQAESALPTRRLAWMHIPKTGSTFVNTISHWTDVDNELPVDASVEDADIGDPLNMFLKKYLTYSWRKFDRIADGTPPMSTGFGHRALTSAIYEPWVGEWVGMFRTPLSRARSHYTHIVMKGQPEAMHATCASLYPGTELMSTEQALGVSGGAAPFHAGLSVKMLAGQESGMCGFMHCTNVNASNTTWPYANSATWTVQNGCQTPGTIVPDVDLAIARLDGFKFVGLQEEWKLSVCLFHTLLGGECFAVEDSVSRAGKYNGTATGGDDPYDDALYAAVEKRFRSDLLKHGVTEESCRSLCPSFEWD
jgi:hypothetical protein